MKKLRAQLFILVYSGMLILAAFLIYGQYQRSLQMAEALVMERLQAIANTLEPRLDGERLASLYQQRPLVPTDSSELLSDTNYLAFNQILQEAFSANELKTPIYTITANESRSELRLGVSSHGPETYGLLYESHVPEHLSVYEDGGTIPPYEDDYGTWLSAIVPLKTNDGKQIAALEVDYPFDDFLMYAQEDLSRNILLAAIIFVIVGVVLFLFMRIPLNRDERRQMELNRAHENIREKKEDLESSIRYAARMQSMLQPTEEELNRFFSDHMILDLPRDTVSGDFFWFKQVDADSALLVVADCTGHGVPGAFMSIMGHDMLNNAVNVGNLRSPREILEYVDDRVCKAFSCATGKTSATDGMDMAVCLIERKKRQMTYAGAKRPLTIINKQDDVEVTRSTRRSIGEHLPKDIRPAFENVTVPITDTCRYFLYSDGLQDQFGGEKDKKVGHARLKRWLQELRQDLRTVGKPHLTRMLHDWKGSADQVDDILLIGFRIQF